MALDDSDIQGLEDQAADIYVNLLRLRRKNNLHKVMEAAANKNTLDKAVAKAIEETKSKLPFLYIPVFQSGYIVIDTTWNRALNYDKVKEVLLEANKSNPTTFFETFEQAETAVRNTRTYKGGCFTWSNNTYIIVPINK